MIRQPSSVPIPRCHPPSSKYSPSMDERAPWAPRHSETEQRRMDAELLYEFEMEARRQGFLADPAYVYDEEHDLFRFRDGRFAFSRACYELG